MRGWHLQDNSKHGIQRGHWTQVDRWPVGGPHLSHSRPVGPHTVQHSTRTCHRIAAARNAANSIHAGGAAVQEPRHLSTETRKRPDLQIVLPNRHILTDVVVTHPLAPSYFRATGKEHLIKAKHAAAAKCRKYAEVADSQQADFIPFSIESTGGIGKEAADLIDQLCTASRDFLSLPSHHPFAHDVFSSLA